MSLPGSVMLVVILVGVGIVIGRSSQDVPNTTGAQGVVGQPAGIKRGELTAHQKKLALTSGEANLKDENHETLKRAAYEMEKQLGDLDKRLKDSQQHNYTMTGQLENHARERETIERELVIMRRVTEEKEADLEAIKVKLVEADEEAKVKEEQRMTLKYEIAETMKR